MEATRFSIRIHVHADADAGPFIGKYEESDIDVAINDLRSQATKALEGCEAFKRLRRLSLSARVEVL